MAKSQIEFSAPMELQAAPADGKRASFVINAYNGGVMSPTIKGGPQLGSLVIDLSGVKVAKASGRVPILFSHDETRVLGQGTPEFSSGIVLTGEFTGEDAHTQSVIAHGKNGFEWEASIGGIVGRTERLKAGKKAVVNGREVTGPLSIIREFVLTETSILAYGADSGTSAAIAASPSHEKEIGMNPQFVAWLQANDIPHENLSEKAVAKLEAQWKVETAPPPRTRNSVDDVLADHEAEGERRRQITELTAQFLSDNPGITGDTTNKIRLLAESAIEAKWSPEKYHYELLKAGQAPVHVFRPSFVNGNGHLSDEQFSKVVQAALCMTGRLEGHEDLFDEQTLEAAHKRYPHGIGLQQMILQCAERNGYRAHYSTQMTLEAHNHAFFGTSISNRLQAAGGFSSNIITNIVANTANKFMSRGFNSVDMTPLRIAKIRSVKDFKQITTVSLTGDLIFQKVGAAGEVKHGALGEVAYTNQADTYARMLAITRQDIINDDTGALTDAPFKLGRGAGLKLNDIFWTEFLGAENDGFFAAGNNNVNTGVADMTIGGLTATEVIFMNQTDPDGNPLGIMPAIIVVPTALKAAAIALMDPQSQLITGASSTLSNVNVFRGRFRVESSPYMSNSSYTGYSAAAWYMLADPNVLPMIEIVALGGRVEPTIEQADADFNVLGIQMRGYSDIGVNLQEKRAAVKPDGNAS